MISPRVDLRGGEWIRLKHPAYVETAKSEALDIFRSDMNITRAVGKLYSVLNAHTGNITLVLPV